MDIYILREKEYGIEEWDIVGYTFDLNVAKDWIKYADLRKKQEYVLVKEFISRWII